MEQAPTPKPGAWHEFAVAEIERSGRRFTPWETTFLKNIKQRLAVNFSLSPLQEKSLVELHRKATEISKIPRRGGR